MTVFGLQPDKLITQITSAAEQLRPFIKNTPTISFNAKEIDKAFGSGQVFIKCENQQLSSTYHIRGCLNSIQMHKNKQVADSKPLKFVTTDECGSALSHCLAFAKASKVIQITFGD